MKTPQTTHYLVTNILALSLLLLQQLALSVPCEPENNCKLPDCRCWNDKNNPGGLTKEDTPQIVLVSFSYVVNGANEGDYVDLFEDIYNPNGCAAKGTFFVQNRDSNPDVIKTLYERKHEIGVTTKDGTTPTSADEWEKSFEDVKLMLENAGIPPNEVLGSRAPELYLGGDDQLDSLVSNQLSYDSSCVSREFATPASFLWPFTYDFVDSVPKCSIGVDVDKPYPGKWQFLVADLQVKGQICASPSSCAQYINSTQEAFDLFFTTFADHYEGERTPFIIYIDPLWLTKDIHRQGTKQFLQFIRAAFEDTWVITNQQALAWIQNPTPLSDIDDFGPWECQ